MIRVATAGTQERMFLHYDNLPPGTKQEFLMTVHKILRTTRATFRGFFARPGAHHFTAHFKLTVDFLTDFLVERKAKLKTEYGSDLELLISDKPALFEAEEKLGGFDEVFSQEKAREEELMAAQEETFMWTPMCLILVISSHFQLKSTSLLISKMKIQSTLFSC